MFSGSRRKRANYIRTFTFGVEDSLVSTVGLLSGVAAANASRDIILLTGIVLIFVEAFSMAVGSLLSEHSAEEYATRSAQPLLASIGLATLMFISYFISGFVPLLPYILAEGSVAFWCSIGISCFSLFCLGAFNAYLQKSAAFVRGLQMAVVGGLAIAVGVIVGGLIQ